MANRVGARVQRSCSPEFDAEVRRVSTTLASNSQVPLLGPILEVLANRRDVSTCSDVRSYRVLLLRLQVVLFESSRPEVSHFDFRLFPRHFSVRRLVGLFSIESR